MLNLPKIFFQCLKGKIPEKLRYKISFIIFMSVYGGVWCQIQSNHLVKYVKRPLMSIHYIYTVINVFLYVPIICLRHKIGHGDHRPMRTFVTNQFCHIITLRKKKLSHIHIFFPTVISVLFARLMHLFWFHYLNIFL